MDEWIRKELKCIKCSKIFSAEILKGSDPYWPMCDDCTKKSIKIDNARGYKMPKPKIYKNDGPVKQWKKTD